MIPVSPGDAFVSVIAVTRQPYTTLLVMFATCDSSFSCSLSTKGSLQQTHLLLQTILSHTSSSRAPTTLVSSDDIREPGFRSPPRTLSTHLHIQYLPANIAILSSHVPILSQSRFPDFLLNVLHSHLPPHTFISNLVHLRNLHLHP